MSEIAIKLDSSNLVQYDEKSDFVRVVGFISDFPPSNASSAVKGLNVLVGIAEGRICDAELLSAVVAEFLIATLKKNDGWNENDHARHFRTKLLSSLAVLHSELGRDLESALKLETQNRGQPIIQSLQRVISEVANTHGVEIHISNLNRQRIVRSNQKSFKDSHLMATLAPTPNEHGVNTVSTSCQQGADTLPTPSAHGVDTRKKEREKKEKKENMNPSDVSQSEPGEDLDAAISSSASLSGSGLRKVSDDVLLPRNETRASRLAIEAQQDNVNDEMARKLRSRELPN